MPMPTDIGVIDLMIGFPEADRRHHYDFLRANLRDHESLDDFEFPAQYMFKDVPKVDAALGRARARRKCRGAPAQQLLPLEVGQILACRDRVTQSCVARIFIHI